MPAVRLNKLLSQLGIASRRTADTLIATGRVDVNGHPVTELGTKVDPERDDVRVDGRRLRAAPDRRYFLIYKPKGVVSTRADPQRRSTVVELLARAGVRGYFFPVGRLDYESEGLMILTNDGDFAQRVAHPRYELSRTYEIHVAGVPDDRDLERLRRGIVIDGGRTQPTTVRVIRVLPGGEEGHAILEMTLHEGRNRQVRRMCDAIGHPVDRLRRVQIGPVSDRALKPGSIRELLPAEIRALTSGPPHERPRDSRTEPARERKDDRPREPHAEPARERKDDRPRDVRGHRAEREIDRRGSRPNGRPRGRERDRARDSNRGPSSGGGRRQEHSVRTSGRAAKGARGTKRR